ncbi:type VI immunity family protein [Methylobacterium fujisawaense]|uniref:type VI immunity family protein n=1 Tax=Methylobacterium fujisawaense TaxID=107400 RepID=UPI00313E0BAB
MIMPSDLRSDPKDIEERGVLRDDRRQKIRSRVGVLVSLYFERGWEQARRAAISQCLEEYIAIPENKIDHYKLPDDTSMRKWDRSGVPDAYRDIDKIGGDEGLYCYMIRRDPKERDDPSLWLFMALGFNVNDTRRRLSGLKAYFAPSYLYADPDRFVDLIKRWAGRLQAAHGSGGLGALSIPGAELMDDAYYYPWLMQYPGLEYDAMGSYFAQSGEDEGYKRPRSSNWLTVLGADNVAALGGREAIEARLTPGMQLIPCGQGVLVRASPLPTLGDAANGGIPEGYRTIARIIKPIRFEGYQYGVIKEPVPVKGPEVTLRWLRRFD